MCDSDVSVVLNRWAPLLNDDWPPSTVGCCRIGSYEPTPGASEAFAYWPRFVLDAKPLVCLASGLPGSTIVYEPGPGEAPSPGWTSSCRALDVEPKPPAPDCNDLPKLFFESVPSSVAVCGSYEPGSPMNVSSASLPRFVLDLNAAEPAFCTGWCKGTWARSGTAALEWACGAPYCCCAEAVHHMLPAPAFAGSSPALP